MTINLAYLGVYREPSGFGQATRNYLKALLRSGAKVAARPIFFSTNITECDKEIQKAEKVMLNEYDVAILACPPYAYEIVEDLPHIGLFFTETSPLPERWAYHCSLMNHIIHPCSDQKIWCNSKFMPESTIIGVPVDTDKYFKSYRIPPFINKSVFNFYTISDFSRRKNFEGLLRAYFYEFTNREQVCLTIKTSGKKADIETFIQMVKVNCGFANIPQINIVTDRLSEDDLMAIHKHSDCYVCASYGEGWNLPAQDAMLFGKSPIVPNYGGQKDFINNKNGWLVPVMEEPCYSGGQTHSELFDGKKTWAAPNLLLLSAFMREAFSNKALREQKSEAGIESVEKFSYENVGSQMLGVVKNVSTKEDAKKKDLQVTRSSGGITA